MIDIIQSIAIIIQSAAIVCLAIAVILKGSRK